MRYEILYNKNTKQMQEYDAEHRERPKGQNMIACNHWCALSCLF